MRADSVTSNRSRLSRSNYRVVSKTSHVDETLFASPKKTKQGRINAAPERETVQVRQPLFALSLLKYLVKPKLINPNQTVVSQPDNSLLFPYIFI